MSWNSVVMMGDADVKYLIEYDLVMLICSLAMYGI